VRAAPAWLTTATPQQRRTLAAAALGWMLDSMDVMLYAMVLPAIALEMHLSPSASGGMMSATLLAAAAGGLFFGWFADRLGRTRALTASMLIYSLATFACGLTHTAGQLAVARIALGLGMGGEWAAGAALVAESWPAIHRNKALAFVQSFWAIGYALGAALTALILPHFGWRAVFFAGVAPALLTLWVQHSVHEPALWQHHRESRPSIRTIFQRPLRRDTLLIATMNAATLFAWWGLFTWVPRYLSMPIASGGRGMGIIQTSTWTIAMQAGTFAGYISFGWVADRIGQKRAYIGYLVGAALAVPIFAAVRSPAALLIAGPIAGFFGTGYFSGFGAITAALFPTSIRGTAMGFVYNIGRVASAAAPYLIGLVSQRSGLAFALSLTSAAFLLAAILATFLRIPTSSHLEELT
jgi:MFS family permease